MALDDMSIVNVGVSSKGLDEIKSDIKTHLVDDAKKHLENTKDIADVLRNAWSGEDCEAFIANLDKMVEEVCSALDNYNTQIETKLDDIYQSWIDFQASNVTGG